MARFDLGNSSSVRKRISVLVLDSDFSDLSVCTFWLRAERAAAPYQMRTHTTKAWTNATIYFYAASAGSERRVLPARQRVARVRAGGVSRPRRRASTRRRRAAGRPGRPGPARQRRLRHRPLAPWGTFGTDHVADRGRRVRVHQARGHRRPASSCSPPAKPMAANEILTATFQLGNSSAVRKRVTVILHDNNFSDLSACTFWLAPGQPLSTYTIARSRRRRGRTRRSRSIRPRPAPISGSGSTTSRSRRTPGTAIVGTECIEPGGSSRTARLSRRRECRRRPAHGERLGRGRQTRPRVDSVDCLGTWPAGPAARAPLDLDRRHRRDILFRSWLSTSASWGEVQVRGDDGEWTTVSVVDGSGRLDADRHRPAPRTWARSSTCGSCSMRLETRCRSAPSHSAKSAPRLLPQYRACRRASIATVAGSSSPRPTMAGVVHFSWYPRYMEEAEHAMWREAGLSIAPEGSNIGFPRVAVFSGLPRAAALRGRVRGLDSHRGDRGSDDSLRVHDHARRHEVATGSMTAVCVRKTPGAHEGDRDPDGDRAAVQDLANQRPFASSIAMDNIASVAIVTLMDDINALLPLPPATFHILLALADEDRHGYAIIQDVAARTDGELRLSAGTLYRSIQRMLEQGLIVETRERPAPEDDDERRRYYRITPLGTAVAKAEARRLTQLVRMARAARLRAGAESGSMRLSTTCCCTCIRRRSATSTARRCARVFARRRRDARGPSGAGVCGSARSREVHRQRRARASRYPAAGPALHRRACCAARPASRSPPR